ncbi:MAG: hypothetical protein IJT27_06210 [Clostridia bacterium]|nr:hypothetical protein [Clostridia bacterium]
MKFGLNPGKKMTGAELSVVVFQAASLLPAIYILVASGLMALFTKKGLPGFLCSLGFSAIPRLEALGLSALYRATASETAVCLGLLLAALDVGITAKKLLRAKEKTAFAARIVYACLLGADLLFRLLPFSFNRSFGFAAAACGFALRLLCLALVTADLAVYKKNHKKTERITKT